MVEKVKGSLLIGALGDAYGSRFVRSDLPAGEEIWTFTPELYYTLATCESLVEKQKPEVKAIGTAMRRWYRSQQLAGLEGETLKTLSELVEGSHWDSVGEEGDINGSGAALRIAPLAFMLDPGSETDRSLLREVVKLTHDSESSFLGAFAVVCAIRFVQNDQQNLVQAIVRQLPESSIRERLQHIAHFGDQRIREVARELGSINTVEVAVPFAIFAAQQAPKIGLQTMMKEIVAVEGEVDKVCTLAGYVAGAYLGMDAIPEDWIDKLKQVEGFEELYPVGKSFAGLVETQNGIQTLF